MATKTFKIGLSNAEKQAMAQNVYERLLALTFPEYDPTQNYNVGDFVVYNDQLYKCIEGTTGAWDSSKWQLATLNDLLTDIEGAVAFVNDKANVDGNYPTMTVGVADNLSPYDEEAGIKQSAPFNFQASGTNNGSNPLATVGELALLKEKRGNTVVVNQFQVSQDINGSVSGITLTFDSAKNKTHIEGTATNTINNLYFDRTGTIKTTPGHKFLLFGCPLGGSLSTYFIDPLVGNNADYAYGQPKDTGNGVIFDAKDSNGNDTFVYGIRVYINNGVTVNADFCAYLIDLTQWFNGDIPQDLLDHPENFFRYYQGSLAYNEGTLVNANARYIKCIGRQQWDEDWEVGYIETETGQNNGDLTDRIRSKNYCKCIPNESYYVKCPNDTTLSVYWYDKDNNYVGLNYSVANTTVTAPSNAVYFKICTLGNYGGTYNHDITISIYYEGESGYDQYYPYELLTNNDTGTETLRSAGSVRDYKEPNGTIHRKVGRIDLGDLTWEKREGETFFFAQLPTMSRGERQNIICAKYTLGDKYDFDNMEMSTGALHYAQEINIADSDYNDVTSFKQSLVGVYLFYELEEEVIEEGTPYAENVEINDFGSMDFSGTNGVPQGNLIFYPVDYKAYLDTIHKYTDGDPDNLALKSDLAIVNEKIGAKIPECPTTTDGTYVLKATVSNGSVVYAWVLEE